MRARMLLLSALMAAGSSFAAMAAGSGNAANDDLLALPPQEQAARLTKGIKGCQGESVFPMGVVSTAKYKGLAYWSVHCKDGRDFAVQIAPDKKAPWIAADCKALQGSGKECFKKF
jgi:hypothetical protein